MKKKEKCCILLDLAGEQMIEVFNTFMFEQGEKDDDPEVLMNKFEDYCNIAYKRHLFDTITSE